MKQTAAQKFSGLSIQKNSFNLKPGALEVAENVVIVDDDVIQKCRGFKKLIQVNENENFNCLFKYAGKLFGITQDSVKKIERNVSNISTLYCFAGLQYVVAKLVNHGLFDGQIVNDFDIPIYDSFLRNFQKLKIGLVGTKSAVVNFNTIVSRTSDVVTFTFENHSLNNGDYIDVVSSNILTPGNYGPIYDVTQNTFKINIVGTDGSGVAVYKNDDTFIMNIENAPTLSGSTTLATYLNYGEMGGEQFTVSGRSRTIGSNGNEYFTSNNGVMKIEGENLPILKAGMPPGLDLQGILVGSSGIIKPNSQVSYRVLFGRRDANANLIIGAPSEYLTVTNYLIEILTAAITYNTGTKVVTVTSIAHGLQTSDFISLFSVDTTPSVAIPDGVRVAVNVVDVDTFEFNLGDTLVDVTSVTQINSLKYGSFKSTELTFTIPSEIKNQGYIYQIYRTIQSTGEDDAPVPVFKLLDEANLSLQDIQKGFVDYLDETDELILASNPELYTNYTQEGELQANFRPPNCKDIAQFKNYTFYANSTNYSMLNLSLVAPSYLNNGNVFKVGVDEYIFRGDANNYFLGNDRVTASASATAGVVTVSWDDHGFLVGDKILVVDSNITDLDELIEVTITATPDADTFEFSDSDATGSGYIDFEGIEDASGRRLVTRTIPSNDTTLAEAILETAESLVKAINRNEGSICYAQYVSASDQTPGKIFLIGKDISAGSFSLNISLESAGLAFVPTIPTTGDSVKSDSRAKKNSLVISKLNEPEAVPIVNEMLVGSENSEILRVMTIGDTLMIVKTDGVYRITGDNIGNFSSTLVDATVSCVASDSVVSLNNSVYMLTNQGVVQCTSSSVRLVSRETIEPVLIAISAQPDVETIASAIGYESDRQYLLCVRDAKSSSPRANIIYAYNYITDTWTTIINDESVFHCGVYDKETNKVFIANEENRNFVMEEMKNLTKTDFVKRSAVCNVYSGIYCQYELYAGSSIATFTSPIPHGLKEDSFVTLFKNSGSEVSNYASVRFLTEVIDEYSFTLSLSSGTNAVNESGTVIVQIGNVDKVYNQAFDDTVESIPSPFTNMISGNAILINYADEKVLSAFSDERDILRPHIVKNVGGSLFFRLPNAPSSDENNGYIQASQYPTHNDKVVIEVDEDEEVLISDVISIKNFIFRILEIKKISNGIYTCKLNDFYPGGYIAETYLLKGIASRLRFSPITSGAVNMIKTHSEMQGHFRNEYACSKLTCYFSSDAYRSSTPVYWERTVGNKKDFTYFNYYGAKVYGDGPYGDHETSGTEFLTESATIFRTQIPSGVFAGTYIQPTIIHKEACEGIYLQNISIYTQPQSNRVSK